MSAMSKKPILSALVVVAVAYMASPYVALYRLQAALRGGDQSILAGMVDWDQVRDGLKQDIAELVVDEPEPQPRATAQLAGAMEVSGSAQLAGSTLPPFGSSFIKGIASKAVDEAITPESVARMGRPDGDAEPGDADPLQSVSLKSAHVTWAFFQSPETFTLWLRSPGQDISEGPVKLRMELLDGSWKITRVWLPPSLLRHQ